MSPYLESILSNIKILSKTEIVLEVVHLSYGKQLGKLNAENLPKIWEIATNLVIREK